VTKIDDLLQRRTKQIVLTIVAWLAHGVPPTANLPARESRIAEIPKRKKADAQPWRSCKIEYLFSLNYSDTSFPNTSRATMPPSDRLKTGGDQRIVRFLPGDTEPTICPKSAIRARERIDQQMLCTNERRHPVSGNLSIVIQGYGRPLRWLGIGLGG
jgi:hypothetical protein